MAGRLDRRELVRAALEGRSDMIVVAGLGAPLWWATGAALNLLLELARRVSAVPGAQAALASVPVAAFGAMVLGGLSILLWRGRARWAGLIPVCVGATVALAAPAPDVIVTNDGRHMAIRAPDGSYATLRPRAGDYVRSVLAERGGSLMPMADLDDLQGADCGSDLCRVDLVRGARGWRILATRSSVIVDRTAMARECSAADIVVSDRRLPPWCRPRWFKADAALLRVTGGLAISLSARRAETVDDGHDAHPWVVAARDAMAGRTGPHRHDHDRRNQSRRDQYRRNRPASRP